MNVNPPKPTNNAGPAKLDKRRHPEPKAAIQGAWSVCKALYCVVKTGFGVTGGIVSKPTGGATQ